MNNDTAYKLTLDSENEKTGRMPVSMSARQTCPDVCPFKAKGCYAGAGPISWTWNKLKGDWQTFLADVAALAAGQIWRHNQAGDLPGENNRLNVRQLADLVLANRGKRGFGYTHKPLWREVERAAVRSANKNGFTINLSADNLAEADRKADMNVGPVVVVLPSEQLTNTTTPKGRKVVICPFATKGIQCVRCQLCSKADRTCIVGFPAHGAANHYVSELVKNA